MRDLTFQGFLSQYLKALSAQNTNSLYKLVREADCDNPRLREPLLLFALVTGKQDVLFQAARNTSLDASYRSVLPYFENRDVITVLSCVPSELPAEYLKVWNSYQVKKSRVQTDNATKELMRQKIMRLQEKNGVSNYRLYTDLNLNPGNLNAWIKHGNSDKVSLETARKAMHYMEKRSASAR